MPRALRNFTIPDHHSRIPVMREEGIQKIAKASTEQLRLTIKHLNRILLLADEQWTVWYEIKDELMERGEWVEPGPSDQKPFWAK